MEVTENLKQMQDCKRDRLYSDSYIAQLLGLPVKEAREYPALIECKRTQVQIIREIRRIENQKQKAL